MPLLVKAALAGGVLPIHVVDDEISIAEFIAEVLEDYSGKIRCFRSAEAYLLYLDSDDWVEPELIISDVQMGGMDGFELIKTLRAKGLKSKIIVISGFNSHFNEPYHDIDYMMTKPFHPDKLLVAVSRLIGLR
ncbi:MAG: hypothetical protein COB41_10040 [Proteobacteria bacterium]|nr:MAG: hypothetical protein COB41_10040 [Pseudomonadota bacterium]